MWLSETELIIIRQTAEYVLQAVFDMIMIMKGTLCDTPFILVTKEHGYITTSILVINHPTTRHAWFLIRIYEP
jgi:hypothetical protein